MQPANTNGLQTGNWKQEQLPYLFMHTYIDIYASTKLNTNTFVQGSQCPEVSEHPRKDSPAGQHLEQTNKHLGWLWMVYVRHLHAGWSTVCH